MLNILEGKHAYVFSICYLYPDDNVHELATITIYANSEKEAGDKAVRMFPLLQVIRETRQIVCQY